MLSRPCGWWRPRGPPSAAPLRRCAARTLRFSRHVAAHAAGGAPHIILGIESSCDDTGAAVVTSDGQVLGEALSSQADVHAPYGGVVPTLAMEAHKGAIDRVVDEALRKAGLTAEQLDAVAVTVGPGLSMCLKVGVMKARQLAAAHRLPIVPVHHMEAHALVARLASISAAAAAAATAAASEAAQTAGEAQAASAAAPHWQAPLQHGSNGSGAQSGGSASGGNAGAGGDLKVNGRNYSNRFAGLGVLPPLSFPFLCLLVSGGHNVVVLVRGVGMYLQLGTTLDDAIGEAYDKVARMLGLELQPSGGAALEALARSGDPQRYPLVVPMRHNRTCDFSYAGLKTAVRLVVEKATGKSVEEGAGAALDAQMRADLAASFQQAAVTHLRERVSRATEWTKEVEPGVRQLVVAGGVASNQMVRQQLAEAAEAAGLRLSLPPPRWCTDNGVMVAWAGAERLGLGLWQPPPRMKEAEVAEGIDVRPRWPLTSIKHPRCSTGVWRGAKLVRVHTSLTDLTSVELSMAPGSSAIDHFNVNTPPPPTTPTSVYVATSSAGSVSDV